MVRSVAIVFFYPSTELTSSIHALRNGDSTMNPSNELRWIDYLIIRIYFVFVLGIGFVPVNSRLAWSQSDFDASFAGLAVDDRQFRGTLLHHLRGHRADAGRVFGQGALLQWICFHGLILT
jgi:hypothetical protein